MPDPLRAARTSSLRAARRRRVERLADGQDGVLSRRQVYAAGITRWEVRANLRARRWRRVGSQGLAVHTGPLSLGGRRWAAVFEAGPRGFLDAWSALEVAGLRKFDADRIRVSVPRGAKVRRARHLDIRQTRRWDAADLVAGDGVPRARPEVAAVRAVLWARSDKQAALVLSMAVQQGIVRVEDVAAEALRVRRDRRRSLLHRLLLDLAGGARSLSEIELGAQCRRRGLPEPSRQVVRRAARGTYYLDAAWEEWDVVVEVDGIHHLWVQNVVGDALRHNDVALEGAVVLRVPVLGLRLAPDDFFAQLERALTSRGWSPPPGGHQDRAL